MKVIKYNFCTISNNGTNEEPIIEEILSPVSITWSEANEELAKKEAYNGEYVIEDDGQPNPIEKPTQLDRIESQVTYTAIMTDTLQEV